MYSVNLQMYSTNHFIMSTGDLSYPKRVILFEMGFFVQPDVIMFSPEYYYYYYYLSTKRKKIFY